MKAGDTQRGDVLVLDGWSIFKLEHTTGKSQQIRQSWCEMSKSLSMRSAHQVTLGKKAEGSQILHVRTFEYILNKREY